MELFIHGVYIVGGLLAYGAVAFVAGHFRGQKVANVAAAKMVAAMSVEKKLVDEIEGTIRKVTGIL